MTNSTIDLAALQDVTICAVTKKHTIAEIENLLKQMPEIKDIAENRYPNCREKFDHFVSPRFGLRKHFIGPLQSNKIFRIVACCDVIQSVETFEHLLKIHECAKKLNKNIKFLLQVNISGDSAKHGIKPEEVRPFIEKYLEAKEYTLGNVRLTGLMTIGEQADPADRYKYFCDLKTLFDQINKQYFPARPLETLSMGMSDDYKEAIRAGATMVRIGTALFG